MARRGRVVGWDEDPQTGVRKFTIEYDPEPFQPTPKQAAIIAIYWKQKQRAVRNAPLPRVVDMEGWCAVHWEKECKRLKIKDPGGPPSRPTIKATLLAAGLPFRSPRRRD
jgi:hypothetical protein